MNSRCCIPVVLCIFLCLIAQEYLSAQAKRTVNIDPGRSNELKLLRRGGTADVKIDRKTLSLNSAELLFERLDKPVVVSRSGEGLSRQELPYRFYGVGPNGNNLDLGVVVDVDGGGMRPSADASSFATKLHFGVIDRQNQNAAQALPVPAHFLVTADVDTISPAGEVRLDHTNLPFVPLTLSAASPRDVVTVQVRPSFSLPNPVTLDVDVIRPELGIEVSPKTIQGWGLEEADIIVRVKGIANPAKSEITLSTTKGGLKAITANLDDHGVATTRIRSIGLGQAKIRATSSRYKAAETELTFAFPWAFIVAVVLGGVVGTLAKKFQSKKVSLKQMAVGLVAGIAVGVLGAGLYALGVNVTGFNIQGRVGELLTFIVAGVVAYVGSLQTKSTAK